MDKYSRIILTIIAVCLLYVSFRLYTLSIFDFIPTPQQILRLAIKDKKKSDEQMEKIHTITRFIIADGIRDAGTLDVEVTGGTIDVTGEIDCNIVR